MGVDPTARPSVALLAVPEALPRAVAAEKPWRKGAPPGVPGTKGTAPAVSCMTEGADSTSCFSWQSNEDCVGGNE